MNKPTKIKVLFIEDSEADMEELLHSLKHGGFEMESSRVEDLESLRLELDRQDWDVVLSDHYLLGFDSFDALALVKAHKSDVPFIVVSGVVEEETAVRAMKLGACDFLKKDRLSRLPSAVSREIAERAARALYRSTQAELKDSEDRFRLMIDAVKDYAIFMLDTDGRFITWNIGSERMFGYSESEAVGAHLSLLYTGSEVGSTHANQALVMTREFGHYEEEGLRRRKDGREFWVHAVMSPVYGPDGTLRGYSRITRDIDELMRGAEALAQAKFNAEEEALARRKLELEREEVEIERGNLKNLFEQTTAILAILAGPDHVFEFANPAYVSLLGENYLGRSFADVQPDLKMLLPLLDKVYLDGETIHQSEVEVTGNDHTRFFDYIFSTKKDGDGKIVGIMMLGSDVTEQRQRRAEAEASSASKSSFLANMSHEIRTPLAAILGFSELLKDMHLVNDERDRYIDTINRNSQALTQIIDDILDMAKIEAGRLDIEGIKFNLSDLLEDVVQLFREKALRKGITLSLKHSPKVPVHVLSDPTRLRQILFNIVGNAIKFTDIGGVEVSCELHDETDGKVRVSIDVKDSGVGISDDQRHRLFQPFSQADNTTTRQFGGTGLGLALSQRLCEALGGSIQILESTPLEGSTFNVSFVTSIVLESEIAPAPLLPVAMHLNGMRLKNLFVLVVDDVPDNLFLVKRYLIKNGARVDLANDGREAVDKALLNHYDVILMDIQMPRMDGYQAIAELKVHNDPTPVVALTAHALIEERMKTVQAGFVGYLTKPFDRDDLINSVERFAMKNMAAMSGGRNEFLS